MNKNEQILMCNKKDKKCKSKIILPLDEKYSKRTKCCKETIIIPDEYNKCNNCNCTEYKRYGCSDFIEINDGKITFYDNTNPLVDISASEDCIHINNCLNVMRHIRTDKLKVNNCLIVKGKTKLNCAIIDNNSNSIDLKTGAVVIKGGVAINKDLNIGGNLYVKNGSIFNDNFSAKNIKLNTLDIVNNDNSHNINTGCLVLKGGMGIHKNVNIGNNLNVKGNIESDGIIKGNKIFQIVNGNTSNSDSEFGIVFERNEFDILKDKVSKKAIVNSRGYNDLKIISDFDIHIGSLIKFDHNDSEHKNEIKKIIDYDKDNRIIKFDTNLKNQAVSGDCFYVYDEIYTGICYNDSEKKILFASLQNTDPFIFIKTANIHANNCKLDGEASALIFSTLSDRKFKKNIKTINETCINNIINNLKVVEYKWKKDKFPQFNFDDNIHIGLIAQEVEKILPSIVRTNNFGEKSVAYDKLTPILIQAVKILQKKINDLENTIKILKKIDKKMI